MACVTGGQQTGGHKRDINLGAAGAFAKQTKTAGFQERIEEGERGANNKPGKITVQHKGSRNVYGCQNNISREK